jgi:hypothetical protein
MVFQSGGALFILVKPAIVRDEELTPYTKWLILLRPMMLATPSSRDTLRISLFKSKAIVQEVTNTHYLLVWSLWDVF